jgi:LacI family transcriptional regulator
MAKRVTVYDIANELNISPSTVSRVLNNSTLISSERSKQILDTAERLGYQKRIIKKHVSRAILNIHLFLPQADSKMTHFFYNISELIESIQDGFGDVNLNFVTRLNDGNLDFLNKKKTGQIDGCVFAFTKPGRELAGALTQRQIPFILLNRRGKSGSYIYYDVNRGLKSMAEKICRSDKRVPRPCFIGYKGLKEISEDRFSAVKDVFCSRGIPFDESSRQDIGDFNEISDWVFQWIRDKHFNTVIAFNDMVAMTILQKAMSMGIRVPEDFSLTGLDDSPLQNILDRRIDTVSLSIWELGRSAGSWMKAVIIDKAEEPLREVLSGEYISGETIYI